MLKVESHDKERLIDPLVKTNATFWTVVAFLSVVVVWGIWLYIEQVRYGLAVTDMNRPIFWGLYMVNFVFFIGISLSGTFTSAILRLTGVEWRRPITRLAEGITVFALIIATIQIAVDMGRPDRFHLIIFYGRLQSPILWDVNIVVTYLLSSAFYLYMPLIPDAALIRDNLPEGTQGWQRYMYTVLALGWRGNVEQWRRLEKIVSLMAIFIIPIAVSVHTITSWLLATTVQPGWHSTVFGPYFVVTAIFSGISAIFILMTVARETLGLEQYITLRQYKGLAWLFITIGIVWGYFTYTENLVLIAGQQLMEFAVLKSKLMGQDALTFWAMLILIAAGFIIVLVALLIPERLSRLYALQPRFVIGAAIYTVVFIFILRDPQLAVAEDSTAIIEFQAFVWATVSLAMLIVFLGVGIWLKQHFVTATVVAGAAVLLGTWIERWNIIVPTVTHPRMIPYDQYSPTTTEIGITVASVALFFLMMIVFFKLFPAVSIWEIEEGRMVAKAHDEVEIGKPEPSSVGTKKRRWSFR